MNEEQIELDQINLLEEELAKIDAISQFTNLQVLPDEQKQSGTKESILDLLIKLERDPREEVESFENFLNIPIGKVFSKIPIEDESGAVSYRKQEGTAFAVDQVSEKVIVLQSVAHNYFYIQKTSKGIVIKEAVETIFLYQVIGDKYYLKYNVVKV